MICSSVREAEEEVYKINWLGNFVIKLLHRGESRRLISWLVDVGIRFGIFEVRELSVQEI